MTWRQYLQSRTRNPAWLWRMVIGILLAGIVAGYAVDQVVPEWISEEGEFIGAAPEPPVPEERRLDELADDGEWLAVWRAIPGAIVRSWRHVGPTALAVLTGACWLAFALQAVQIRSRRDGRLWASLLAVALGVLSIWPTMFLILWQERRWGMHMDPNVAPGVRYLVLGVGLREELSKLVCFLPLLPYLVRRRDELGALIAAGCVGIGFATEENIAYIAATGGAATLTRLLTPAPLHMAMTGLVGLAAYRACVWPRQCGPQFVAMFGVVVVAHGLFDAFQALPALFEYAIVSDLIFILLVYQFFRELRPKQQLRVEPVSLTANFLFCISTVAAATFVYLSAAAGWKAAGDVLVMSIAGQAIMAYLFLREMPETMVTV